MVRVRSRARNVARIGPRQRLQARAFALLYGRGARFYDRFTSWLFLGEWAAWQQAALPFLPPTGLILELGCGTGRLAHRGKAAERLWLGLDRSPEMLAVVRRGRIPGGPSFVRGDARRLSVEDGAAAAVVATFPTSYILDPAVAAEIRRVLKPDGRLVVVISGELLSDRWRRQVRRWALRSLYGATQPRGRIELELPGFSATRHAVDTTHGMADVYVLESIVDRDG